MKNKLRRLKSDRGQAVVMAGLTLFAFGLFSAISVDAGIYMVDRRDGQNDVDKAALAGALELTLTPATAGVDAAAAEAQALEWATKNGINTSEPGLSLVIDAISTCYSADDGVPTGVQVSLVREPDWFFLNFVDAITPVTDWTVKTAAIACAGRPIDMLGVVPFALSETSDCFTGPADNRVPRLGEYCDIVIDSNASGLSGELGIAQAGDCEDGNGSADVLEENIIEGAHVPCIVGQSVQGNAGHNVGKTKSGMEERIAGEGACDANPDVDGGLFAQGNTAMDGYSSSPLKSPVRGDGHDDFYEIWEYHGDSSNPAADLVTYDCEPGTPGVQTSPRNVALIVVHDFAVPDGAEGPKSYEIQGFARMYLEGCTDSGGDFHKDCDWSGGGKFTIHARFVQQIGLTNSSLGHETTYGDIEVFLKQ